jgi:hypothetical protein
MVCEKQTDSYVRGGGLLGHMTRLAPADRLIFWHTAGVLLYHGRGQSAQSDRQGSLQSYVGTEALFNAVYASRVLDHCVPASLLRGTCAVQTAAGRRGSILGTVLDEATWVIAGVFSCDGAASCR